MALFLLLQSTYKHVEVALFDDTTLLSFMREDKIRASKTYIPLIAFSLMRAGKTIDQLSFIGVNQGPGPFTTLRVVIATANGLSFATDTPLVGIDGLDAFLHEYRSSADDYTLVLLNAFNQDVYFALQEQGGTCIKKGYDTITNVITFLQKELPQSSSIRFLGNGTTLHKNAIITALGKRAHLPEPIPLHCSVTALAECALQHWQASRNISTQLQPRYLKKVL